MEEDLIFAEDIDVNVFDQAKVPSRASLSGAVERSGEVAMSSAGRVASVSRPRVDAITYTPRTGVAVAMAAAFGIGSFECQQLERQHAAVWTNPGTEQAIAESVVLDEGAAAVEQRFHRLLRAWERDTEFASSAHVVLDHPAYRAMTAMGRSALPLILADLRQHRRPWAFALERITGENPVPEADRAWPARVRAAWLEWGKKHRHVG